MDVVNQDLILLIVILIDEWEGNVGTRKSEEQSIDSTHEYIF